jgi:hypothetical protein
MSLQAAADTTSKMASYLHANISLRVPMLPDTIKSTPSEEHGLVRDRH